MENCVGAAHPAVLDALPLQANKIGRAARRLTSRQEQRPAYLRNAIEHSDAKLPGRRYGKCPTFDKPDPYSIELGSARLHGHRQNALTYKELVSAMAKCHQMIEVIREYRPGARASVS